MFASGSKTCLLKQRKAWFILSYVVFFLSLSAQAKWRISDEKFAEWKKNLTLATEQWTADDTPIEKQCHLDIQNTLM
jgi:hypothetical protein